VTASSAVSPWSAVPLMACFTPRRCLPVLDDGELARLRSSELAPADSSRSSHAYLKHSVAQTYRRYARVGRVNATGRRAAPITNPPGRDPVRLSASPPPGPG